MIITLPASLGWPKAVSVCRSWVPLCRSLNTCRGGHRGLLPRWFHPSWPSAASQGADNIRGSAHHKQLSIWIECRRRGFEPAFPRCRSVRIESAPFGAAGKPLRIGSSAERAQNRSLGLATGVWPSLRRCPLIIDAPMLSRSPHRRNPAHARRGFGRSRSIRRRISANSARGTATGTRRSPAARRQNR
jgi:hypothetical protein